jgi:segregation and condensation protein A
MSRKMADSPRTSKDNGPTQAPNSLQTLVSLSIMGEMVEIRVEGFSGPVDTLLELIDSNKLDVTALSLAEVTDQYWKVIETREMDADTLSEFIGIGTKLLYIKSCAILPGARQPTGDIRGEIDQAAEELALLLQEHKRFKDAVDLFRQIEEEGRRTFARTAPARSSVPLPPGLDGVTVNTLLDIVKEALANAPEEVPQPRNGKNGKAQAVIHIEPVTVDEKISEISGALKRGAGRLPFRPLLSACKTRTEIVVLFLAVLELIKGGNLCAEQPQAFGDIELIEQAPEPAGTQA